VVGIPVRETVPHPDRLCVIEVDRVKLPETLRVKGCVVAIGLPDTVKEVVGDANCEGGIVITGVAERVMLTDTVRVKDTVAERVKAWVVGMPV